MLGGSAARHWLEAGEAMLLAGGPTAFSACRLYHRDAKGDVGCYRAPLGGLRDWAGGLDGGEADCIALWLERLSAPRPGIPWPGGLLSWEQPLIMAVVNVTPDSFSDGGEHLEPKAAIERGLACVAQGAHIIDIGGASARPGATAISVAEELARVIPVIEGLADCGVPLSIDTCRAEVMAAALDAGAAIINDITALNGDPDSLGVAAGRLAPVVLMHMLGEPGTMQNDPEYDHALLDVYDALETRVAACEDAGLPRRLISIDPGIGFGKTAAHNMQLLNGLGLFHGLGCSIVLGVSRKSFIAALCRGEEASDRLGGSLAAALAGVSAGVQVLRVHDVAETRQALEIRAKIAFGDELA